MFFRLVLISVIVSFNGINGSTLSHSHATICFKEVSSSLNVEFIDSVVKDAFTEDFGVVSNS